MEYRQLGTTDLHVSPVAFGTAPLGELFGPLDEPSALRLVDEALDLGTNFVDSSRYCGSAEGRLGKALTPAKRDGVILSTKAGGRGVPVRGECVDRRDELLDRAEAAARPPVNAQ